MLSIIKNFSILFFFTIYFFLYFHIEANNTFKIEDSFIFRNLSQDIRLSFEDKEKKPFSIEPESFFQSGSDFPPGLKSDKGSIFKKLIDNPCWIQFSFIENRKNLSPLYLELGWSAIDKIEVYYRNKEGTFIKKESGDLFPFYQREIPEPGFIFRIPSYKQKKQDVLLRIQSKGSVPISLKLYNHATFTELKSQKTLMHGIFYGTLLAMFLYNCFIYIRLQDKAYLYYNLYVFSILFTTLILDGYSYKYFWPTKPSLQNNTLLFFINLSLSFASLFCISFLNLSNLYTKAYTFLKAYTFFSFIFAVISLFTYKFYFTILIFFSIFIFLILLSFAIYQKFRYKKEPNKKFFALAWIFYSIGIVLFISWHLGLVPDYTIFSHGLHLGAVLETLLLGFALADKIDLILKEKKVAQIEALENLQRIQILKAEVTQQLEEKVEQRTRLIKIQQLELEKQIDLAQRIHNTLLPKKIPETNHFELFHNFRPMMKLGGDFLDFRYNRLRQKLNLFICDVCGHGIGAAFLAVMVKMTLDADESKEENPAKILKDLHEHLDANLAGNFITAMACHIDLRRGRLQLASAGHPPAILFQSGEEYQLIKPKGKLITSGITPNCENSKIKLTDNSLLLLYTDGLVEVRNKQDELFSETNLANLVAGNLDKSLPEISELIMEELESFCPGSLSSPEDDISYILFRYKK